MNNVYDGVILGLIGAVATVIVDRVTGGAI